MDLSNYGQEMGGSYTKEYLPEEHPGWLGRKIIHKGQGEENNS